MSTKVCRECIYFKLNMQQFPCCDCRDGSQWKMADDDKPDNINHPAHYEGNTSLECIDVMEIAFGADAVGNFCLCNAFKYLWRYKHKGGDEDVKKAKWYLDRWTQTAGRYTECEAYQKMRDMAEEVAQPERLTDDDFETIRIHLNAYKEKLCNQQRWEEAEEYQRIIDRFMAFASAQPEPHWIPCSERQPDVNGWYITTISGEICGQDRAFSGMSEFANGKWTSGDDADETEMTIAWMPLPEPYQGGEQE